MNLMKFLLRSSRGIVILSAIAGVVGGIAGIALIALIQRELASESSSPDAMVWAFVALCLLSAAARIVGQVSMIKLGQGAIAELGLQMVRRTLRLPLRAFEMIDTSALLAALTEDIVLIANAMVGVAHLCINIPIVIACVIYLGWLSPVILVCGVMFASLAIAVSVFLSARGVQDLRRARGQQDTLVGHFRTLIDGFRELKLHGGRRGAYLAESLEPTVAAVRGSMVRGLNCFAIIEGWNQIAFFGFIGILLFIIPHFQPVGRPTLVSAVLVVLYLMTPLDVILTWLPILGRVRASLWKVQALMPRLQHRPDEADGRLVPARRLAFRDSISLEGATFTYRDSHEDAGFSLGPVDLTLRPGELVILAGGNGCGKTTLVKLISGLYRPERGILRLDGRVVGEEDREAYRQLVSVVFADGYLFPNFLGLLLDGLEAKARAGLERLGLAPPVSVQGSSFSTIDLSQGQRRRLALLGAWLEDRPICILDEWAANQDPSFKEVFYSELLPEMRAAGKALLVISHDESQFGIADRVVHLQDGRLLDEPLEIGGEWARGGSLRAPNN
jgi:putative pyoverdin transport system ATP-binding/permease protein